MFYVQDPKIGSIRFGVKRPLISAPPFSHFRPSLLRLRIFRRTKSRGVHKVHQSVLTPGRYLRWRSKMSLSLTPYLFPTVNGFQCVGLYCLDRVLESRGSRVRLWEGLSRDLLMSSTYPSPLLSESTFLLVPRSTVTTLLVRQNRDFDQTNHSVSGDSYSLSQKRDLTQIKVCLQVLKVCIRQTDQSSLILLFSEITGRLRGGTRTTLRHRRRPQSCGLSVSSRRQSSYPRRRPDWAQI